MHTDRVVRIGPPNRREQLVRWVESWCDGVAFTLSPLSGGASARNFFRLEFVDSRPTLIVMDAPTHGDSHRFVRVARLLADAGVHAPDVIAEDLEQGFLVISDLADASYLSEPNNDNADSLFEPATPAWLTDSIPWKEGTSRFSWNLHATRALPATPCWRANGSETSTSVLQEDPLAPIAWDKFRV